MRARFRQGLTFTVAVALGAEKPARDFVQTLLGERTQLRDCINGVHVYSVPPKGLAISRLFKEIEANKERLSISNYGLEHPTLEAVFLQVVGTYTV